MSPIRQAVRQELLRRLQKDMVLAVQVCDRILPRHPEAAANDVKQIVVEEIERVRKCLSEGSAS